MAIVGPWHQGPFYWYGLTLIAWISNFIHYKVCHEITYPFLALPFRFDLEEKYWHGSCVVIWLFDDDVIKWKTFSALLVLCEGNPPGTCGFPSQRPVTRSFDIFCDMRLNKRFSKQSTRWFGTPSHSLWRHCNMKNIETLSASLDPWVTITKGPLHWRHHGHDRVSNHRPRDCLLNRVFRRRPKKISKLSVTGLCAGNSPETGEFPAQMASNAQNVSIWWRHHVAILSCSIFFKVNLYKLMNKQPSSRWFESYAHATWQ